MKRLTKFPKSLRSAVSSQSRGPSSAGSFVRKHIFRRRLIGTLRKHGVDALKSEAFRNGIFAVYCTYAQIPCVACTYKMRSFFPQPLVFMLPRAHHFLLSAVRSRSKPPRSKRASFSAVMLSRSAKYPPGGSAIASLLPAVNVFLAIIVRGFLFFSFLFRLFLRYFYFRLIHSGALHAIIRGHRASRAPGHGTVTTTRTCTQMIIVSDPTATRFDRVFSRVRLHYYQWRDERFSSERD